MTRAEIIDELAKRSPNIANNKQMLDQVWVSVGTMLDILDWCGMLHAASRPYVFADGRVIFLRMDDAETVFVGRVEFRRTLAPDGSVYYREASKEPTQLPVPSSGVPRCLP